MARDSVVDEAMSDSRAKMVAETWSSLTPALCLVTISKVVHSIAVQRQPQNLIVTSLRAFRREDFFLSSPHIISCSSTGFTEPHVSVEKFDASH